MAQQPETNAKEPSFYLNIHTSDPKAAAAFFTGLGFTFCPDYSDDETKSFRLPSPNDSICLMIHAHTRFKTFMRPGTAVTDAHTSTEALFSVALATKDQVVQMIDKAVELGGKADPYRMEEDGATCGMYTRAIADLDGHIWEFLTMLPKSEAPAS